MAEIVIPIAGMLASVAANEVFRSWNLKNDLDELHKRWNLSQDLVSDARAFPPTLESVRKWFEILEAKTNEIAAFMNELHSDVVRVDGVHLYNRSRAAGKIKEFRDSLDEIYEEASKIGFQPVEHLMSHLRSKGQSRDMGSTPPIEDESQIVGRDNHGSYLVQTVSGINKENLQIIVTRDVSNIEEASRARLHEKSHIRHLVLSWKNNEDGRGDREFNDVDVMKGLQAHPYL